MNLAADVKITAEALKSGKDVYCEKPLTLTVDEGRIISQVAKETDRIIQVGTQQRSEYDRMFLKAVVLARSGRLGKKLHALSSVGQPDFVVGNTGWGRVGGIEYDFINGILYGIDWNNYWDANGPRLIRIDPARYYQEFSNYDRTGVGYQG